jgi:muskelin
MIFVPSSQLLYIFAGQRDENFLSDMYTYSTSGTHEIAEISSDYTTEGRGPEAGFTQVCYPLGR